MNIPLSIITINLNNKDGLMKTIESVEKQIFKDFEFIVVDGESVDGSVQIIESKRNIITQAIIEKDSGIYNAMNKGIQKANGKYLYFLNSGDILFHHDALSQIFKEDNDSSFICTNFYTEHENIKSYHTPYRNRDWSFSLYDIYSGYLCHQAFFIQKQMFNLYGLYNEKLKIVSDWELFLIAIGLHHEPVCYKDIDLVVFNAEGLSSTIGGKAIYTEKKTVAQERLSPYLASRLDKIYSLEQDQYIVDITNNSVLLKTLVRIYGKLGRIFKK